MSQEKAAADYLSHNSRCKNHYHPVFCRIPDIAAAPRPLRAEGRQHRQGALYYLILILLAGSAVFAFFNRGCLRSQGFIHYGEMYYYCIGTKYYREMSYFDLYNAMVVAGSQENNTLNQVTQFLELETYNLIIPRAALHRTDIINESKSYNFTQAILNRN